MSERIAVVGLGYVGLPLAVALADKFENVIGFDIKKDRVAELQQGVDSTLEIDEDRLKASRLKCTSNVEDVKSSNFYIVTVPTPVDENNQPDLTPVISATRSVGKVLSKGDVVVYESTVYPGVTEELCAPLLAKESGLKAGVDFKVGYSPERINPGDKEHTVERIVKVVSAEDEESLARVGNVYGSVIKAGIFKASSIKVAEAAKVIENTQRDVNIALMNELALIFDRIGIRTKDVLAAAGTKWNFLPFRPGLVGGHCIGVDPYYLTTKAMSLGYHPQVILSGRRINDGMGEEIARKMVKLMIHSGIQVNGAKVGVLGLTFKENVPDLRNSRVPDILEELATFGVNCVVHDPWVCAEEAEAEYGVKVRPFEDLNHLDGLVVAVMHREFVGLGASGLAKMLKRPAVVVDVKSVYEPSDFPDDVRYWSL